MVKLPVVLLAAMFVMALLGFAGIAQAVAGLAQALFLIFLGLFVASLLLGKRPTV